MERSRLTEGAGGGVGEMVASRGQREEGVFAHGTTHVELLQQIGLSENLQHQAEEWVAELENTQQHMQQIVGDLASVARAGSVVDWGGSTMSTWLEDKCQQLSTILWQIVEDPELEPFVDWQRADTLIMNCNMIYSDGVDYYDELKERLSSETSTKARETMISASATINTMAPTSLLPSAAVPVTYLPLSTSATKTSFQMTATRFADVATHKTASCYNDNNNKNYKSNDAVVRAIGHPLPPPFFPPFFLAFSCFFGVDGGGRAIGQVEWIVRQTRRVGGGARSEMVE
ncbi:hypothetical protein CBR_g12403 [Chara braunii]|uniref:Uncharacterized protein n=1 Tax=Chara braunii TaxID=69332 RepID=A0A388KS17_CHABU|nr:hypothetical protein CBR_g12403 [Chara braunii]|eukprot:GBG72836.1 hypothetical protein CBR_g12403 [Chara braunii]